MNNLQLSFISFLLIVMSGCGFSASTANIAEAKLAHDADGNETTTTFAQDEVFYAVVELANAPDDTTVKAVWTAVEAEGTDPNLLIDETELASGSGSLNFSLTNDQLWPVGKYKVELFLNDELDRTLEFEVEGEATVAEEPEPTPTPEPTEEPTPTNTPQTSTGDTLGGGSSGDTLGGTTEEDEIEPLPFQAEPYVHPSGAFGFAVPEGWELLAENETVATFGSEDSLVGTEFFNAETDFDEETMQNFIELYLDDFIVSDEYEVLSQEVQPDDSIYVAVTSQSEGGETVDADFFFEQRGTIVYILYFSTFVYEEMSPTWNEIITSYTIDPEAALLAAPASTPTPEPEPPTPTPAAPPPPPPTATPAPAANPFAPPPGVARVYLVNLYGSEYNIDFGDGSGSIAVLPGVENFYHDVAPGSYNPGLSLPGGGATNIQFEINADEAWVIIVTEELGVKGGQVYP